MATEKPELPTERRRILRTREEIFAAGYEVGLKMAPLTEKQINICAALFASTLNAPRDTKRDAA